MRTDHALYCAVADEFVLKELDGRAVNRAEVRHVGNVVDDLLAVNGQRSEMVDLSVHPSRVLPLRQLRC